MTKHAGLMLPASRVMPIAIPLDALRLCTLVIFPQSHQMHSIPMPWRGTGPGSPSESRSEHAWALFLLHFSPCSGLAVA